MLLIVMVCAPTFSLTQGLIGRISMMGPGDGASAPAINLNGRRNLWSWARAVYRPPTSQIFPAWMSFAETPFIRGNGLTKMWILQASALPSSERAHPQFSLFL